MRRFHHIAAGAVAVVGCCVLLVGVQAARGDEASSKAQLAEKGIHVTHSAITLQAEAEFVKSVSTANSLRRKSSSATNGEPVSAFDNEEAEARIAALSRQNEALQKQLAEMRVANITFLGQTGQQINLQIAANDREIAQIQESRKKSSKPAGEPRKDQKSSRDALAQQVSDARILADHLLDQYSELNKDAEVLAAIKEWNEASHTHLSLKPSRGFESALRRLEALEKKLPSEKIPLRHEGSNYYTDVMINGEQKCEMVVDTAAALVLLPHRVAADAGLKIDRAGETVTVQAGDGSKVQAQRGLLKSLRVGSFSAKNVPCGVLPETDKSAKAVLGASFLKHFKAELDTSASELALARPGAESSHTRRTRPTAKHRPKADSADASQD